MKLFIKNILWINPGDSEHNNTLSFRIGDGILLEFGPHIIENQAEEVIDGNGYCCSPGWIDLICRAGAPGNPQNESIETLANAAAAGGFTKIMLQPDTRPIIQSIESVSYYKNLKPKNGIEFLVSAASTQNLEGKKMAEMLRLSKAGASSFSLTQSMADSGFFGRILQYLQHCGKVLIDQPSDQFLAKGGQINEGNVSERRGLAGIPIEAEEIIVDRDISILKYVGGKLHLSCLSSAQSVLKTALAKSEGHSVSSSISANQLAFTDENLDQFDTVHKVLPPYRSEEKRQELIKVLKDGKVDAVTSNHTPLHYDFKDIEFENADFGISALETTFSALVHYGEISNPEAIVNLLHIGPSKIIGLEREELKKGIKTSFTLFSTRKTTKFETQNWQSKSKNNPFIGTELSGLVLGIVTEYGFALNPHTKSIPESK